MIGRGRFRRSSFTPAGGEVDLITGCLAYYTLDNNLNDTSGNGRDLVGASPTYGTPGVLGSHFLTTGNGTWSDFFFGPLIESCSVSLWLRNTMSGSINTAPAAAVYPGLGTGIINIDRTVSSVISSVTAYHSEAAGSAGAGGLGTGWNHIAATAGPDGLVLYVNGAEAGSDPTAFVAANAPYLYVEAGSRHDVDEVAFYSRVLTPAEVAALYNGGSGLNPFA